MRALVTGGGGFLGSAICRQLRKRGDEVSSISRGDHPHLRKLGVTTLRGDLGDAAALSKACEGQDVVFHVAAKAGVWGSKREYFETNVIGTQNVVSACRAARVPRLVHTSSPSVCFDGGDHRMAGANLPYAKDFLAHYPASKAEAERTVLAENNASLATCALRPHLIFGPGDPHLLPRLVETARQGKLAVVGDGNNEVTLCYVENGARAHLLAADGLKAQAPHAGRAYFIGQERPVNLWSWVHELLSRLEVPAIDRKLSQRSAYRLGAVLEWFWRILPLGGEPPMTRFVATQLATSHSYSMEPAREAFGYEEAVDMDEATALTVDWLARRP